MDKISGLLGKTPSGGCMLFFCILFYKHMTTKQLKPFLNPKPNDIASNLPGELSFLVFSMSSGCRYFANQ